jgi:hypothetical protein
MAARPEPTAGSSRVRVQPLRAAGDSAERAVLGAVLRDPSCASVVHARLRVADYALPAHRAIAAAIEFAVADRGTVDPVLVGDVLAQRGQLDEVGGVGELWAIADDCVTAAGVDAHVDVVLEHAERRRVLDIVRRAQLAAEDGAGVDEIRTLLAAVTEASVAANAPRVRTWIEVAEDPPVAWIVLGLVPAGGLIVLAGEPAAGKTLLALDVALRAAHGMRWLGREVRACSTVYLAGEGSSGLGARVRAWRAAHPSARVAAGHYVAIADGVPDLMQPRSLGELEQLVTAAKREHGTAPSLLVVDTLAMATPGSDENDAGPVGAAMATLAEIRKRHGLAVLVLHHTRKPAPGAAVGMHSVRGSSAIVGAADVVLLAGADGDARSLRVAKSRDGECGGSLRYAIVGQDTGKARDDGRAEHGPVVLPADAAPAAPVPADEDAIDTARLVAAVRRLAGTATTRDALSQAAGVRAVRGRALIDLAVASGAITIAPATGRRTIYGVGTPSFSRAPQSPHTPRTAGTAGEPPAPTVPDGHRPEPDGGTAEGAA